VVCQQCLEGVAEQRERETSMLCWGSIVFDGLVVIETSGSIPDVNVAGNFGVDSDLPPAHAGFGDNKRFDQLFVIDTAPVMSLPYANFAPCILRIIVSICLQARTNWGMICLPICCSSATIIKVVSNLGI